MPSRRRVVWPILLPGFLVCAPAAAAVAADANGRPESVLFADPGNRTASLGTPEQKCAGNSGPDPSSGGAWGMACLFMKPPLDPTAPKPVFSRFYGLQVGIELPPLPADPGRLTDGRDQVAIYPEVRQGAWSNGAWAINPLVQVGPDAGGSIVDEEDLNNFSGCDSPGIDLRSTGGSNRFIPARSDGSPCPTRFGLLVTGVGNRVSSGAIDISGVSNQAGMMWQDGIRMVGGYLVNEYELYTDTSSRTAIRIKGAHGFYGLDLSDGGFGHGAIGLSSASAANGRIAWNCPAAGCGGGWPRHAEIAPGADGALHLLGADLALDGSLRARGNLLTGPGANLVTANPDGSPGAFFGTDRATGLGTVANARDPARDGLITGTVKASSVEAGSVRAATIEADGAVRFAVRTRATLPPGCRDGDTVLLRDLRQLASCLDGRFYAGGRAVGPGG